MNETVAVVLIQALSILGMTMNILSYQGKQPKTVIWIQFFGSLFFAVHFFLLNAITGAMLNLIGVLRAVIYANKEKLRYVRLLNVLFIAVYLLTYVATFTVFEKAPTLFNFVVEILPVVAMIATTISFSKTSAATIRKFAFISSPSWLIYNCVNVSVGGILCESFALISVILAMIRLDRKSGE
jgi:hypothetical protein